MRDSSGKQRVQGMAVVREVLGPRHCHAALPNGKLILAHVPERLVIDLSPGLSLCVSLSVCDFSHGEVIGSGGHAGIE